MLLGFGWTIHSCWAGDAAPVRKVVRQYALTSANDFAQRDPQDWRLLGSNDRGHTWDLLDIRQNELFPRRQQRKIYHLDNRRAYGTYRLQIDGVRNPSMVNSVQLAEVELMGETEADHGPTPNFHDEVAARGENPPAEKANNLFDGRIETKWLDWPTNEPARRSWVQWSYRPPETAVITNLGLLLSLPPGGADGFPVRLVAVVAGPPGPGGIRVLDRSGWLPLDGVAGLDRPAPGQAVALTGTTRWAQGRMGLTGGQARPLGAPPPIRPLALSPTAPFGLADDLSQAEAAGRVARRCATPGELSFDLKEGTWNVRVHCPPEAEPALLPAEGSRVAARGICTGALNESGQFVPAHLWVADPHAIKSLDPNEPPSPAGAPPSPAPPTGSAAHILTTVRQVRELGESEMAARPRVHLRGIITEPHAEFIQDATAGIRLIFHDESTRWPAGLASCVEVTGEAELDGNGNPVISVSALEVLGTGKLPRPQSVSSGQLMSGHIDAQWIEVSGIVRATDGAHLLVISDGEEFMATLYGTPNALVNALVDGEVRLRGVGVTARDDRGRIQGTHLLIPSLDNLEVTRAPAAIEQLPVRKIGSLQGLSGPRQFFHRIKVEGTVTLQDNVKLFLQDDTGGASAFLEQHVELDASFGHSLWLYWRTPAPAAPETALARFAPGDRVRVVGFSEAHRYSPVLTEVKVEKIEGSEPVTAIALTRDGIEEGGLDSTLVTLDGVLRGKNLIGPTWVLALEWQNRTLQVLAPEKEIDFASLALGSRLRVTGVCQVDPAPYAELGLGVGAVRIQSRTRRDIAVLEQPSWWTLRRALIFMGAMALIILAAFVWIFELRHQVKLRTAQLAAEIRLREQTEQHRVLEEERARIAKDLHDDLGANLTQIVFLSERVNDSHQDGQDAARWFNLIPATARRTIQSLDEIVWAVNPRHDSLESLCNYLSQFAQEFLNLARLRCVLDVPLVLPAVPLSAEVRHNLLLAVREALQNAVTHAAASEVRLELKLDSSGVRIAIIDNGEGFDPASLSAHGNGLANMQRRLASIGGQLELQSAPGQGATVRLFVPAHALPFRAIGNGTKDAANS